MNLLSIDPSLNPAEDNWLNREIAIRIFGDENRFNELTQEHFNNITKISFVTDADNNENSITIPKQIGNLVNLKSLLIVTNDNT